MRSWNWSERVEAVERVLQQASRSAAVLASVRPRHRGAAPADSPSRKRLVQGAGGIAAAIRYLVEEAIRARVEGQRADLFALRVARANAALEGRNALNADDLRRAVELVILPRAALLAGTAGCGRHRPRRQAAQRLRRPADHPTRRPADQPEPPRHPDRGALPDDVHVLPRGGAAGSAGCWPWPPAAATAPRQGRRRRPGPLPGTGPLRQTLDSPRADPARRHRRHPAGRRPPPEGPPAGQALGLRIAAAGWHGPQLLLRDDDLRAKLLARKAGALMIFVVDASGSMALNRMQAAKGAVLQLLSQAYRSRDQIALIMFRGERAEVLLPPTRSITAASRRLERLPCGGGSPLAHGLALAVRLGQNARQSKDVGEVVIVLISDGKANVSLQPITGLCR